MKTKRKQDEELREMQEKRAKDEGIAAKELYKELRAELGMPAIEQKH
jgi:hypothetical protein